MLSPLFYIAQGFKNRVSVAKIFTLISKKHNDDTLGSLNIEPVYLTILLEYLLIKCLQKFPITIYF